MQPYQLNSTDWIKQELAGLLGEQVTRDINDIIRLYSLYDGDGQRWRVETKGLDYTPTVKVTNIIAELIGKEARYMMGVEPELHIVPKEKDSKAARANADIIGDWLTALLEEQKWSKKLLDAAKDCFIASVSRSSSRAGAAASWEFSFAPALNLYTTLTRRTWTG